MQSAGTNAEQRNTMDMTPQTSLKIAAPFIVLLVLVTALSLYVRDYHPEVKLPFATVMK